MLEREAGCLCLLEIKPSEDSSPCSQQRMLMGGDFFVKHDCAVLTPKEDCQHHLTACVGWYF